MRSYIFTLAALILASALVACGGPAPSAPTGYAPDQTVRAYAYVHGGYVGEAIVTTDAEGNLSAQLDEAFLPHTLAIVDIDDAQWNEDNTVFYRGRSGPIYVAKHISYAGTNYVGTTVGGSVTYVAADDNGEPNGTLDLELIILRNQNTMASYFDNLRAGEFAVHTGFGEPAMPVTTTAYGSVFKRGSTYWSQGLGWQGNMNFIETAAAQYGVGFTLEQMTRGDDDRWRLADVVTRATASDFIDYFGLIQAAAGRLRMQ